MTDAERKILRVLDAVKAHWDLYPKKGYRSQGNGGYSYIRGAGVIEISVSKLVDDSGIGFEQIEPILHKLQEEGFFKKVEMLSDYV